MDGNPVNLVDPRGLSSDGTPDNNQAQNKQFRDIVVELGLTKDQARQLHEEITGQDMSYGEIRVRAIEIFPGYGAK